MTIRPHCTRALPPLVAFALLTGCGSERSGGVATAPPPEIRASRLFAGPGQYPPTEFAAYGIVAFRSGVTSDSRDRYLAICEGYLAGLAAASDLEARGIPLDEQMATVWPLTDGALATGLNLPGANARGQCAAIVDGIDIITSRDAIAKAARSPQATEFDGRGPYLIAWSPATAVGQRDVPVLIADLSNVTTIAQATNMFTSWAVDIERSPELWRNGWDRERLRTVLRQWADRYGPAILRALGLEK